MEELRLVHVCVNFPHPLSPLLSFSLTSIMSTGKEQTIDSQHLFIFICSEYH